MGSSRSSVLSVAPRPPADRLIGSETPRVFTAPLRKLTPRTSAGFALIAFAEEILELELLPWQKWLAIHALELLPDGSFRFRTVVLLVARQNGKSTFLQVLALFFLFIRGVAMVIGTAQNLDIAEEVWAGAVEMAQGVPELAVEVSDVVMTNGKKALVLSRGERYKVQAATRRGGRGLSGDLVMLDELREHQSWNAWGAVTKTTMARALAQVWGASNAGDRNSVVLAFLRHLAHLALGDPDGLGPMAASAAPERDEDLGLDESLGLFEWSAPPGCALNDRAGWAQANPAVGHTITERAIASAMRTDPEAVFRTEVLCQFVDQVEPHIIDPVTWASLNAGNLEVLSPTLAVEIALDRSGAWIGACWEHAQRRHVEIVDSDEGVEWVLPRLLEVTASHSITTVVIDMGTEARSLVQPLEDAGLTVIKVGGPERAVACAGLYDDVLTGSLSHNGDPELTAALGAARWKDVGDGARAFSRRRSSGNIAPLYAVTLARYGSVLSPDYDVLNSFY